MSRKRFNPLENPPAASSGDEDEVDTSIGEGEEVEESSSEEEEDDASSGNPAVKKPETALAVAEKNRVSDSESGSEEETDSDNETERKAPVKNQASSAVKSVAETKDSVAAKSQDSKKGKSSAKSATKKRPSETDVAAAASTDAKRVKRVSGEDEKKSGGEEETKKTYFQRIWTEDDEISVLQGVIDYETDTGASPFVNSTGFYESVKESISFEVRKIQLMEKVRGLKKKFENNRCKGKKGEDPTFAKPHDRKAFELSKIIWGENGLFPESAMKSNGKSKKSSSKSKPSKEELISSLLNGKSCEDEVAANKGEASSIKEVDAFVKPVLVTSLSRFGVDDLAAQQGWRRLASEDKKRFEEEWEQLQLKEFEFYSQRSGFFHAVVTKMAETFRPST